MTRSRQQKYGRLYGTSIRGATRILVALLLAGVPSAFTLAAAPGDTLSSPPGPRPLQPSEMDTTRAPGEFNGIVRPDSSGVFPLPFRYIDPGSFVAEAPRSRILRADSAYSLNPTAGRLSWLHGTPPESLFVSFRYLPVSVLDTVQRRSPLRAVEVDSLLASGESVVTLPRSRDLFAGPEGPFGANLRRSGHILRGVEVGSGRDVSLESGLRLALDGRLARDIEIKALLDDRNLPIQPEGTSRRLEELNQVYVDINSGRTRGRFGDYRLRLDAGRYGQADRRLQGGRVIYGGPDVQATAAGAVTRSVFHTNQFRGTDGVQGPYPLTGREGERDIVVLGGSEKVWIDGVPMQRGENGDYTIDYTRGEITFTPSRPISSESRIEVDFEYSPEAFPRNLYAGQAAISDPSKRYSAVASFVQEADDPDRPLEFDMTPGVRNALAAAGDGPGPAYVPSADSLGAFRGDYTRVDTTWTDGATFRIFRFVPPGDQGLPRGEWSVPFSSVGEGSGDYERTYDPTYGTYVFSWVGPDRGAWAPVRKLPLPERRRNGALALHAEPNDRVSMDADLGVSGYDANLLSPIGDANNVGVAQQYAASVRPFGGVEGAAPAELTLGVRHEGADYRAFSRTRPVDYDRRWGIDSTGGGIGEAEDEARLTVRPLDRASFSAGVGQLHRTGNGTAGFATPTDFLSRRWDAGGGYDGTRFESNALYERIQSRDHTLGSHSDWQRARGDARYRLGRWLPGVDAEWEDRDDSRAGTWLGHRYLRWRGTWGLADWKGHSGSVHYEQRQRDTQTGASRYASLYRESGEGLLWDYNPVTAPWRSEVELTHRQKNFSVADSADVTTDLAGVRAGYTPLGGALSTDLNYRLSRTVTRPNVLIAYQVPVGEGDYIRVGDEYVYDPEVGDIILRPEPAGDALPTTNLTAALNLDWSPDRLPNGAGKIPGFGWEDISLVTQLEALEITRWNRPSDIYLMRFADFQTDSTVQGRLALQQDVYLFRSSRLFNARLRYQAEKRLNNLYLTGAEQYGLDTWDLRLRNALGPDIDVETEGSWQRRSKQLARRESGDRFRLLRAGTTVSWRPSHVWKLSMQVRGLLDRQLGNPSPVRGLGIRPGVTWALRELGRVTADFEALWVESKMTVVPFELADGRPLGRNGRGNLRADYRLGDHLTARVIYTVRMDHYRKPLHLARVEVNAFF